MIAGLAHGLVDAGYFLPHLALLTMLTLGMAAAGLGNEDAARERTR